MFGTAGLPHVIVRFFTVKRVADARKSAGWALLFIAILYTTAPAIAVFSRTNLIETVSNKEYATLPDWFGNWEKTGLIKFDDKNNDGLVQYLADTKKNELIVDKDIMVLANPEIAQLPNWVIALVAAGGLAAALSTAAGLLLVISSSVSHDLIKKMINPDISEKGELVAARLSAVVAVCVAGYFGINPPDFVAATVALAFGLAAASFFPAIVLGIFSKRMNKEGAISGMLVGILLMLFYIPVIIEMPYIFSLWLKDVPEYAVIFCRLLLIRNLIEQLFLTLSASIAAVGNIKKFQTYTSLLNFSPLIVVTRLP